MNKILILCALALPLSAHAYDREQLERSCKIEQGSLLKERNGTPSCTLLKQQRQNRIAKKRPPEPSERNRAAKTAKPKKQANGEGAGYRWNPNENRHCQHDARGIPTQCY